LSFLAILVILFGSVYILLNQDSVQNKIRIAILADLRERLKTDLNIEKLRITPFSNVELMDVYVKDRSGDTALVADRIYAGIDLWALLQKQVVVTSIAMSDFRVRLSKDTKKSPLNIQFIMDAFASKKKNQPSAYEVKIDFVNLKRGKANFDIKDQDYTPSKIDFNHLDVLDLNAKFALKSLKSDSLNIIVKQLELKEKSGLDIQNLTARLTTSKNQWYIKGFELNLPSSDIRFNHLSFAFGKGNSMLERLAFKLDLQPSQITPKDISAFVPALAKFKDVLNIRVKASGKVNDIHVESLNLLYGDKMKLVANAEIKDVLHRNKLYLLATIGHLYANKAGIEGLSKNLTANKINVPPVVNNLGNISFSGDISGYLDKLLAFGTIETNLGNIQTEMLFGIIPGKESYLNGKISTSNFRLGKLLDNKNLNTVTLGLTVKMNKPYNGQSRGLIDGAIYDVDYNGYNYKNIQLNGTYEGKKLDGILSLSDPNIQLNIKGLADLSQKTPVFNLYAKAHHIQLDKLNLYNKQNLSALSFSMRANFSGNNLDNAIGTLDIDSVTLSKQDNHLFIKQFSIESSKEPNSRLFRIHSDFLNGEVAGQFSFSSLAQSITSTLGKYVPTFIASNFGKAKQNNSFTFNFVVGNTDKISAMLQLPVAIHNDAKIFGFYDNQHEQFGLEGYFPSITAGGQNIQSGMIACNNSQKSKLVGNLNGVIFGKNGVANNIGVDLWAANDSIHTNVSFDSENKEKFQGTFLTLTHFKRDRSSNKLQTLIDVVPGDLILNDSIWHLHESEIKVASGAISFENFILQNRSGSQSLKIDGSYSAKDPDQKLKANLDDIDLEYVFKMLKIKALDFGGLASGEIVASSFSGRPCYICNLTAKGFKFNDSPLGNLELYSELEKQTGKILLRGNITNDAGDKTYVEGFISPLSRELSIDFDAHHINIGFIKKYVSTLFNRVEGIGSGKVRLVGDLSNVTVEGDAAIEKATIGVGFLNTNYSFSDTIHLKRDLISFDKVKFYDESGNIAICSGKVSHNYFDDITYNISLDSHNFLVFNGTEKMNPTFSGKIFASGNGSIIGDEQAVHLNMQIETEANSFLRLNFMNETATQYSFISYKKPQERIDTTHPQESSATQKKNTGMDVFMNFYISATPEATVELVMDPVSGDVVKGNGSGNIQFEWDMKTDPKIYGNYVINKGTYNFTFQRIMEKRFSIEDGSSVQFRGDPYAANLDIKAIYKLTANLNDLSQSIAQTSGQTNVAVQCLLNISGELRHPNIGLDMALPTVDAEIQRQVKNLISSEDMMNRQIVYLLLLSKFYTPSENLADNTNRTTNFASVASATLSSNLSNILSQIDQRWQFGTNIRTSNSEFTNTEVELLLSSQLLNDRLLINGNVGYRNNLQTQNAFVGEVDLEMLLNKSGNLRLKAYNHLNEKYYYYANPGATLQTQGVGLLYKRDFNTLGDLFSRKNKVANADAVRRDTIRPVIPDSSKKGSSLSSFVRVKK